MNVPNQFEQALLAWRAVDDLEVLGPGMFDSYFINTLATHRRLLAVLKPKNNEHIILIVRIAAQYKIPLYTISIGQNWGYGSALPAVDDCVVLDLSLLNRIIHFDPHVGCVTVEPGVTEYRKYKRYFLHLNPARSILRTTPIATS